MTPFAAAWTITRLHKIRWARSVARHRMVSWESVRGDGVALPEVGGRTDALRSRLDVRYVLPTSMAHAFKSGGRGGR